MLESSLRCIPHIDRSMDLEKLSFSERELRGREGGREGSRLPRAQRRMQKPKLPFDYSKWDKIDLSDDEDDFHPNIDNASFIRCAHEFCLFLLYMGRLCGRVGGCGRGSW